MRMTAQEARQSLMPKTRMTAEEARQMVAANETGQPEANNSLEPIDFSNPESDSPLTQIGKGIYIGAGKGFQGLSNLMGEPTPYEKEHLARMNNYMDKASGWADLGNIAEQIPQYAIASALTPMGGLVGLGARTLGAGLTAAATSPENRGKEAALSGIGQFAGEGITGLLGKALTGPGVAIGEGKLKALYDKGLRPTIGQAVGGGWKTLEEKLFDTPFIGTPIREAHDRALESFNTLHLKDIIKELNTGVEDISSNNLPEAANTLKQAFTTIDNLEPGSKGIDDVSQAISKVYDHLAANSSGELTQSLKDSFLNLHNAASRISPQAQNLFDEHLKTTVLSRIRPYERISGETFKQIDDDLGDLIASLKNPNKSSTDNLLGDAFVKVKGDLTDMMEEQNPGFADILRNADAAYRKLALFSGATNTNVRNELATPANLLAKLKEEDKSTKWKKNFATSKDQWTKDARDSLSLIGDKYMNSGTQGRLSVQNLITGILAGKAGYLPLALGAGGVVEGIYRPSIQNLLVKSLINEPGSTRAKAIGLSQLLSKPIGNIGAAGLSQVGR